MMAASLSRSTPGIATMAVSMPQRSAISGPSSVPQRMGTPWYSPSRSGSSSRMTTGL
jgi:hypothetical protein